MKVIIRLGTSLFLAGLILIVTSGTLKAQDPVQVAPKQNKVLFENEHVRVLEFWIQSGAKMPMHSHPANVVYVFSGSKFKFTFPDGKSSERETRNGEVIWSDSVTHAVENTGDNDAHGMVFELKPAPKNTMEK